MLKIVVCVKAVPDPEEEHRIRIDPGTRNLVRGDVALVLNSLDRHALETAVQLKERQGADITVLSMGPPAADNIVRECLALGADHGVLLCDPAFAGADVLATAYTLARGIRRLGAVEVVFCGRASSDSGTEWVGPEIATFLRFPVVTRVQEITSCDGERWTVRAGWGNGYRRVGVQLPAVLTVTRELNTPRALSFSGIVKARSKDITRWGLQDLGLSADAVGLKGSPTMVSDLAGLESRRRVKMIAGTREEKAERLIRKLTEAGVV